MVEIYDFPDGRLEVRWKGRSLPYSAFDKLQRVSHAAIVENRRLGEILAWIKEQQDRQPRFNRVPDGPRRSSQKPGVLKNRALQITEAAKSCPKAHRRGRRRCDMEAPRRRLTLPARLPSDILTLQIEPSRECPIDHRPGLKPFSNRLKNCRSAIQWPTLKLTFLSESVAFVI